MFYGALAAISVSPMCMVAGIWQIAAGFIIIVVEVRHFTPTSLVHSHWSKNVEAFIGRELEICSWRCYASSLM